MVQLLLMNADAPDCTVMFFTPGRVRRALVRSEDEANGVIAGVNATPSRDSVKVPVSGGVAGARCVENVALGRPSAGARSTFRRLMVG